ncbi:hypothetical protein PCL_04722 [Purpureocillium lilacinum]|uniref:Uncharacterized protein n=1 Tax=Purpureocillium lilacinum TaxID=33203 RepID=A0A2U3DX93_PURLI|nr:hypothetical protein Purlil1_10817 [Purpureocillium lilacinum]PWI66878.1 hypothetical protein PCL_04722 [Purpureocillium lilacinum]
MRSRPVRNGRQTQRNTREKARRGRTQLAVVVGIVGTATGLAIVVVRWSGEAEMEAEGSRSFPRLAGQVVVASWQDAQRGLVRSADVGTSAAVPAHPAPWRAPPPPIIVNASTCLWAALPTVRTYYLVYCSALQRLRLTCGTEVDTTWAAGPQGSVPSMCPLAGAPPPPVGVSAGAGLRVSPPRRNSRAAGPAWWPR